jgi:hypothetical protein
MGAKSSNVRRAGVPGMTTSVFTSTLAELASYGPGGDGETHNSMPGFWPYSLCSVERWLGPFRFLRHIGELHRARGFKPVLNCADKSVGYSAGGPI